MTGNVAQHIEDGEWMEATEHPGRRIMMRFHNLFVESGEDVVDEVTLAFRGRGEIEADLVSAGFVVDSVFGDWEQTPFAADDPVMVFCAHAD